MSINIQPGYPSKKPPIPDYMRIATVGSQVGLAIIGIILLALLIGLGIDEILQTEKHPFTILLFLVSAPFSLVVTYLLARRATRDLNSNPTVVKPGIPQEEEEKSE